MSIEARSGIEFVGDDSQIVSLLESANRAGASDATATAM